MICKNRIKKTGSYNTIFIKITRDLFDYTCIFLSADNFLMYF